MATRLRWINALRAPPASLRILLAEDDETTVFSISRLLEKSGHSVTVARNGHEALDLHAAHDFDLILMDVQMPVLDGIESTRRIREDGPEEKRSIPIIALTAYSMNGDREKFLAAGMNGYIAKPVELDVLLRTVAEVKRLEESTPVNPSWPPYCHQGSTPLCRDTTTGGSPFYWEQSLWPERSLPGGLPSGLTARCVKICAARPASWPKH